MIKRRIRPLTILTRELYLFGNIFFRLVWTTRMGRYNIVSCNDLRTRLEEFNIAMMPEQSGNFVCVQLQNGFANHVLLQ